MRSKVAETILERITQQQIEEARKRAEELIEESDRNGLSYYLDILNKAGHFPIGITEMAGEETFIFRTEKEAKKAWQSRTLGNAGWFYGIKSFRKEKKWWEELTNRELKVYWIWKK